MEMRSFRDTMTIVEQGASDRGTEGARRATGVAPSEAPCSIMAIVSRKDLISISHLLPALH
jgi:hypothetical protein